MRKRLASGSRITLHHTHSEGTTELTGYLIDQAPAPGSWWVLLDEGPYTEKYGRWIKVRVDDLGQKKVVD